MKGRELTWGPVALLSLAIAFVVARSAGAIGDPDLWWHLRLGNELIAQRSLSAPSGWSTFATTPWVPTEAVPEIVAATFDRSFGLSGVAWLHAVALCLVLLSVYVTARFRGIPSLAALGAIVTLIGIGGSLSPRPQLLSFALLPVVMAAWLASEEDLRPRWWLVPMTWLWALLHGFWVFSVAYGLISAIVICVERRPGVQASSRLVAVPLLSGASVLLSPIGIGVFEAPFAVRDAAPWVLEWGRTTPHNHFAQATVIMILVTVAAWVARRHRPSMLRIVLLVSAAFWVWYAYRTVAVACLVVVPLMVEALSPSRAGRSAPRRSEIWALVGVTTVSLAGLGMLLARFPAHVDGAPTALDPALDRLPAGTTVLNSYGVGGWLTWRHPDLNQMMDGLATPYPPEYAADYHSAMLGEPGWQQFVVETGARVAYLDVSSPLIPKLESIGWKELGTGYRFELLTAPKGLSD